MTKTLYAIIIATVCPVILSGCGDFQPHAVTWNDIARTIPAGPEYVVSVNSDFVADSALNDIWAKEEVLGLLQKGIDLDSVKPDHFVVVALPKATFITWPLPNPAEVAKKVKDWSLASLNNTVDAHILVHGKASLVVSSTQAWVVNSAHGEKYVNEILQAALNTKAEHTQPFQECITATPSAVRAVVPYEGKYYVLELNHEEGLLRIDVDAYDKRNRRLDIVDGLGRLPIEYIDEASAVSPFAAVAIEAGTMPGLLKRLAKLPDNSKIRLGINLLAPDFADAAGTVVARWNTDAMEVKIPFTSRDAAEISAKKVRRVLHTAGYHPEIYTQKNNLIAEYNISDGLPPIDADRTTPHRHSETENPSAVAYARLDFGWEDPVELYFELAPTHARLQLDYVENTYNLAKAVQLVKTLVFKVL